MARGWQPVQEATLLSFAIYGELLVMAMLVPYLAEPGRLVDTLSIPSYYRAFFLHCLQW